MSGKSKVRHLNAGPKKTFCQHLPTESKKIEQKASHCHSLNTKTLLTKVKTKEILRPQANRQARCNLDGLLGDAQRRLHPEGALPLLQGDLPAGPKE